MSNLSSPASFKGHPIHPVLVSFPIALLTFSLICDVLGMLYAANRVWALVALYCMIGGIVSALVAAVPGIIDMLALSDNRVKKIAIYHMLINLGVVAIFIVDAVLRFGGNGGTIPFVLSVAGVVALFASGWLGGEMVYVHGVAVHPLLDGPAEMRAKDRVHGQMRAARER